MLKIKFKKFFSLFLVVVLLLTHVGTAYAQNSESSSETSTSSEVTVDDETTSSDFNYEESEEEVEEELEEENIEKEEPENPEDYAEEASENVEEETELSEEDTAEVTEVSKERSEEDTKEETELSEGNVDEETELSEEGVEEETEVSVTETEIEKTEAEGEGSDVARSAAEKTEAEGEGSDVARSAAEETTVAEQEEEIEVEIIDGEVVEKNSTAGETEETEGTEETLEEVAETVPVTYAQDPGLPDISWVGTPECEASYDITIDPNGGTVSKLTVAGVEVDLSGIDTTQIFIHTITTSRTEEIEIVAENEVGEEVALFPQVTDHTYTYSVSSITVSSHKINSTCSVCGLDCGEAQFDAPSGIGVEWEEGGAEPFGLPVYPSPDDWLAPLLLLVYENNEHVPAPTSPNQPTVRLETADGQVLVTQTFTILKRQSLDPPTGITTQNASSASADDGSILGVDVDTMEWQTESPQTQPYQPIPSSPWTGLTPGTYRIRFKETDDHIASIAAVVTVGYNQPPSPGGGGSGGGGGLGTVSLGNPSTPYAPIGETIPNISAQLVVDTVSNTTKAVTLANGVTTYVKGWGFVHDNVNNADNWYYFNPTTDLMETGWLTEKGNVYYLHTNEDYLKGRVYSGWHNISGIVYYFSETNYALELMLSLSEAQSHGIITYEDSIAAFQEGRILEATHGTMGLETMNSNVDQQSAAQAQAQLQLQIQNAVTTELVREALAARQDIIRAIERGALSIEDAYAMSGGQIPAIDYKSNMQSNQEIINQIANLIAAFR